MPSAHLAVIGKNALAMLPPITAQYLTAKPNVKPDIGRVLLIANNPSISTSLLDTLLQPNDMLILFNHFIHADYFAHSPTAKALPKLLFFRQIGDSKLHFGLPPRHNNVAAMQSMAKTDSISMLFSNSPYRFPTLDDDPSPNDDPIDHTVALTISEPLSTQLKSAHYSNSISEHHAVVADYPAFTDVHSSAASSGFFMYRLILAVRQYLVAEQNPAFDILLLGFNHDKKTDYFWSGHNWAFEREQTQHLPEGVTLIKAD